MENNELVAALLELKKAVLDLKQVQLETNQKMAEAMQHTHLTSTISMLKNDIVLRRNLEQVIY